MRAMRWRCAHRAHADAGAPLAFLEVEAPTSELAVEEAMAHVPEGHHVVAVDRLD